MRVFMTKDFARFARQEKIDDDALCEAIERAERGLIDADLGGNLIKQRIARRGHGRSGGFRAIIALHTSERAVFLHGFAKSSKDNVSDAELEALKKLGSAVLTMAAATVAKALQQGRWTEVTCDGEKVQE